METCRKYLLPALGVVIALAVVYYAWSWLGSRNVVAAPDVLAETALMSPSYAEREEAAVTLASVPVEGREYVRQVYQQSKAPEVRAACINGMARRWDYDSMDSLLAALEDDSPLVRGRAGAAVQQMLGVNFFFRAMDPPDKRTEKIKQIRAAWNVMRTTSRLEEWNARREASQKG